MAYDAQDLRRLMQEFSGGSDQRYRHTFNRRFIYTEGVQAVAEAAGAYWLLDKVALELAPLYAKAWLEGNASIGIVKFTVPKDGTEQRPVVILSLADDAPPAYELALDFTTFPEGDWVFFLGTDEIGPESYVTTMYLPQEH
jgi:hypothetical protein